MLSILFIMEITFACVVGKSTEDFTRSPRIKGGAPGNNAINFSAYWDDLSIVYRSLGYFDVVLEAAEALMNLAVHEIQKLPHYPESGEVRSCTCVHSTCRSICIHLHNTRT